MVHSLIDELIGYLSFDKCSLILELHDFFSFMFSYLLAGYSTPKPTHGKVSFPVQT